MRILPVLVVAVALAGCDQSIEIHSPDTRAASASPAPSLADQPVDASKPSTHAGDPPGTSAVADQTAARDTGANAPAETLTPEKEATKMPLAGQANNHSSPAFEKRNGGG